MTVMKALQQIPPVNDVLGRSELSELGSLLDQPFVSRILNEVLAQTRKRLRSEDSEASREELTESIALELRRRIEAFLTPSLRRVINASGVILHTNLGRAPLPEAAIDHIRAMSIGYSNLEFDVGQGSRGKRDSHVAGLVNELLGSETAIVVNNNAAAVLLVVNSLAEGGEVLASRGEQVEIGGSFRIPEVMAKSGARLVDVGTTNRTRIEDYESEIGPDTRLMLRVHPSNFKIVGFTQRPSLEEFVSLGQRRGVPTFEDLGSGCMTDLSSLGITDEPVPRDSVEAGMDVVSFSGDKLLGGPQAGIIAGRKAVVDRIRANPMFRALRVDKLTLAALEAVLLAHLRGDLSEIPVWRMLLAKEGELRDRAEAFARRAGSVAAPVPLESVVGGGSVPEAPIASWGITVSLDGVSAVELERRFRNGKRAVVVRIEDDLVLLDLRTVRREEEDDLLDALKEVVSD